MGAPIRYLSVCSGIEAATQAWHPLGWQPVAFSEIEPFPCAVLAHHYPHVPNRGDMTKFEEWPDDAIDLLVGGTPCQDFSIAGLGAGLDGARGNLMLTYGAIARRYRPRWLAWENVPGVLSNDGGRAFGSLLGLLTGKRVEVPAGGWLTSGAVEGIEGAYGVAWRVVDAQFARTRRFPFAVPQRRRRVFVVGYLGDWRRAAAVLFDRYCLSGNPPPGRSAGQIPAPTLAARTKGGGGLGTDFDLDSGLIAAETAPTLDSSYGRLQGASGQDMHHGHSHLVAHALHGECFDASEAVAPIALVPFDTTQITSPANVSNPKPGDPCHPLAAGAHPPAIAFDCKGTQVQFTTDGWHCDPCSAGSDASHQNAGGHAAVAYGLRSDAGRSGEAMTPSPDAEGRVRLRAPGFNWCEEFAPTLDASQPHSVVTGFAVRRLTPRECERLQGFPDDYTSIPTYDGWRRMDETETPADCEALGMRTKQTRTGWWVNDPDGPRYKVLGNSMPVNVMEWLGERIAIVDALKGDALEVVA